MNTASQAEVKGITKTELQMLRYIYLHHSPHGSASLTFLPARLCNGLHVLHTTPATHMAHSLITQHQHMTYMHTKPITYTAHQTNFEHCTPVQDLHDTQAHCLKSHHKEGRF